MTRMLTLILVAALPFALPAAADDLPQGLQSARILPGWTNAEGDRIAALELVLEPGWKTYWRSPGDAGLPPEFDWQGSNMGEVAFHWPVPEIIVSDGVRTLGYHDRLVLPFTVSPEQDGQPIGISAHISFGLCENICIPASLDLIAPAAGETPDPVIEAAMAAIPQPSDQQPACELSEIEDGMKITLSAPDAGADLAVEYHGAPGIWVSAPAFNADKTEVTVDLVAPSGKPFALDPGAVVMTVLGKAGATEFKGCATG